MNKITTILINLIIMGISINSQADISYERFKAEFSFLSAEQTDGVLEAMISVLAAKGTNEIANRIKSFESSNPNQYFKDENHTPKGFYTAPIKSPDCVITWGSAGVNGSAACSITGEQTKYGNKKNHYGIYYIKDITRDMLAINPHATEANIQAMTDSIFNAIDMLYGEKVILDGFGYFKKSVVTGKWSFTGEKKLYILAP